MPQTHSVAAFCPAQGMVVRPGAYESSSAGAVTYILGLGTSRRPRRYATRSARTGLRWFACANDGWEKNSSRREAERESPADEQARLQDRTDLRERSQEPAPEDRFVPAFAMTAIIGYMAIIAWDTLKSSGLL